MLAGDFTSSFPPLEQPHQRPNHHASGLHGRGRGLAVHFLPEAAVDEPHDRHGAVLLQLREPSPPPSPQTQSGDPFPLFSICSKFYDNPEPMVRIAVRTITLNCLKGLWWRRRVR